MNSVEDLADLNKCLDVDPDYFNLVFPDGIPKDRKMSVGKHSAFNYVVLRSAIAKAERLDPHLADMLMWSVWWRCIDSNRAKFLSDDYYEKLSQLTAANERIAVLEDALRPFDQMQDFASLLKDDPGDNVISLTVMVSALRAAAAALSTGKDG